MKDNFTLDELLIKVMPGGFLLGVMYFTFSSRLNFDLKSDLDFLYTFIFFCSAYIVGELLQTIAHEFEWLIDSFFKFRRPSKIFLYDENPVLKSSYKRIEILNQLNSQNIDISPFDRNYKDLPLLNHKKSKEADSLSQSIFWKLYSNFSSTDEIKIFNRNYLFVRAMMVEFLIIGVLFIFTDLKALSYVSFIISVLLLWRCRGMARNLVFKTVILNLRN